MRPLSNWLVLAPLVASLALATGRAGAQSLFSPPFQSYGTGGYPNSVAIADLNADGHSDLVTANLSSSSVSVLLGYGGGAFGSQTSFPTGNNPYLVAIADMNADGRPDLATANYASRLVVYDVSGREVSRREVGSFGAGRHMVTLGAPVLASGIYLVHLIEGDRRLVARAIVGR